MFGTGIQIITDIGKSIGVRSDTLALVGMELTVTLGTILYLGKVSRKIDRLEQKIENGIKPKIENRKHKKIIKFLPCGCVDRRETVHYCGKKMDPYCTDIEMDFNMSRCTESSNVMTCEHICNSECDELCVKKSQTVGIDDNRIDTESNYRLMLQEIELLKHNLGQEIQYIREKVSKTRKEVGVMYQVLKDVMKE